MPFDDPGGFSDFFKTLFGEGTGRTERQARPRRGQDHEAELSISREDAFRGARKDVSLQTAELAPSGDIERKSRRYNVNIPPGTVHGARIRMTGQGGAGQDGGPAGDLFLRVHVTPHPRFRLRGRNLEIDLAITPWEAALGDKIPVDTLDGRASVTIPPGAQGGARLRLKGKGMPARGGAAAGDLVVYLQLEVPAALSAKERELFEQLKAHSTFNPRGR